ncbi:MAG: tyrosine-type recombinase/integrase [Crocinitomicaceae bacterium]|nr:tyrosine-type recombinase/integrase [Crocinitomicaceae bacterium]
MIPLFFADNFFVYLTSEKRFSEHTILAYKKDVEQFASFCDIDSLEDVNEVTAKLVRAWVVDLLDQGLSTSSVNRKLSTLRTFFKWCMREGISSHNPMLLVRGVKSKKRLPSFAQNDEMKLVNIRPLFTDDFEGVRDLLIFEVLYQTGIRSSELIGLKEADVSDELIKVLGKRNKERIIPISSDLVGIIEVYREKRREIDPNPEYFFLLKSGKKLYPKLVYRKINNYLGKATGLDKKSPHVLRHTFATHMLNNGAGLEVLKEILGHANLSATQIYTHNSFAQLTDIYSQSHPRGQKK